MYTILLYIIAKAKIPQFNLASKGASSKTIFITSRWYIFFICYIKVIVVAFKNSPRIPRFPRTFHFKTVPALPAFYPHSPHLKKLTIHYKTNWEKCGECGENTGNAWNAWNAGTYWNATSYEMNAKARIFQFDLGSTGAPCENFL